ncbi:MAG: hypothetical protein ACYCZR_02170 [Burkholderiales bacterium]
MTKKDLALLGRVFDAEINGRLPAQIESKRMNDLEADGLVEKMDITYPGRFPITINGWQLTHAGRFAFCSSCDKDEK